MNSFKLIILIVGLMLSIFTVYAQQPMAALNSRINNDSLTQYLQQSFNDQWFVYRIPAAENTRSMCCFNQDETAVCDLNRTHHGYGSSDSSSYTEHIRLFVHINKGQVQQVLPVGDHCEVKAEGLGIDWLQQVSVTQSIQWLKQLIASVGDGDDNGSLFALSLHDDKAAAQAMYELAINNANEYSAQAVFWLSQRPKDGLAYLQALYEELPLGEARSQIGFALSQINQPEAVNLLKQIAQYDPQIEQQADAIFWLSQTDTEGDIAKFLISILAQSTSSEIKQKAVFSLSQMKSEIAESELIKLVTGHNDSEVRSQALFWLAQTKPMLGEKAAINLIQNSQQSDEQEQAVFVLSQLPAKHASVALFKIVKGHYDRHIKKKALFWLSQSDDEDTLKQLENLL